MPDFQSQAFFFVDFGATPAAGASAGSGGTSRKLTTVKSAKIKDDRGVEVVLAVGVNQGAGFREKQGGGELTLAVYQTVGKVPEVDWRQAKIDKKVLTFTIQGESNGMRESFTCRVSKVDSGNDDQGVHEDEVTLVYTQRYKS